MPFTRTSLQRLHPSRGSSRTIPSWETLVAPSSLRAASGLMRPWTRLVMIAASGMLLGACSYFSREIEPYSPPAFAGTPRPDRGRTLYLRDCAWCHGNRGRGTTRGPDLVSGRNGAAFTHFVLSTGRMPIDSPFEPVTRKHPLYTEEEIADIVEFIESFGTPGPHIPDPDPLRGDLSLGAELYQAHCAACHSTTGIGSALTTGRRGDLEGEVARKSGILAPDILQSTPTQIAEAMLVGPGTMPVFAPPTFTTEEINSIVRYVIYLQDPRDRGGTPLGRIGPVVEGAVALVAGLGFLLVGLRWIGTTSRVR